ncbi:hypothetical protein [Geobacter anodireducens]
MKNKGTTMDDRNFEAANALRAVYEQRACPPDDVLFAVERSEELMAHLGYCRYCNERLEMTAADQGAWEELSRQLKQQLSEKRPEFAPAPGQVWSLDRKRLGGWGPYDRYYNTPLVLVLKLQDDGQTLRVAQVCAEEGLKGDDGADVWLDDSIGFAESWNVFSVHRDDLMTCLAEVGQSVARDVLMQARNLPHESESAPAPVIREFREFEIQVGAFMAMQAMPQVMAEVELVEELEKVEEAACELQLRKIFGTVDQLKKRAFEKAKEWKLPEVAGSILDFLAGAEPRSVLGLAAVQPQEKTKLINLVSPDDDGVFVGTVTAIISAARKNAEGSFFIRCSLDQKQGETCHLFACLEVEDLAREVSSFTIKAGTRAFTLTFPGVPASACNAETVKNNVKMILVRT